MGIIGEYLENRAVEKVEATSQEAFKKICSAYQDGALGSSVRVKAKRRPLALPYKEYCRDIGRSTLDKLGSIGMRDLVSYDDAVTSTQTFVGVDSLTPVKPARPVIVFNVNTELL